ncbi:hypothetical protein OIU77_005710 [Salix suchowensis]|uniref:Disease resistance R13L4/SHOC-2-like LRR domain-containing protein n=1 Tax=Salix suchowensis TaxID=1278906 RepID=A0ABQ9ARI0_9ROSI|nr:hypothetical protein OIU77_005710 [Salix suchowensis]
MGDWYLNATLFLPFQELNTLDLGLNDIAGCVANEGFERLSRLNKLESLDLGDNNFNNSVLSSLKGLSSLKHLHLYGNRLNGSIDTKDFDSLSELEELDLSFNEIQNFVTSTGFERLSRLNKLESLDLGFNNLNNSILSSLKGLSSLKHLYLYDNQLKGSIDPKDFDSLSELEELYLGGNEIQNFVTSTGSERSLGLNKLEILGLSFNKFNDSSLSFLEGLSSLKQLNLDNNQLKGPMDIKGLSSLEEFQLSTLDRPDIEQESVNWDSSR